MNHVEGVAIMIGIAIVVCVASHDSAQLLIVFIR